MDQKINANTSMRAQLEALRDSTRAQLDALTGGSYAGQSAFALAA